MDLPAQRAVVSHPKMYETDTPQHDVAPLHQNFYATSAAINNDLRGGMSIVGNRGTSMVDEARRGNAALSAKLKNLSSSLTEQARNAIKEGFQMKNHDGRYLPTPSPTSATSSDIKGKSVKEMWMEYVKDKKGKSKKK